MALSACFEAVPLKLPEPGTFASAILLVEEDAVVRAYAYQPQSPQLSVRFLSRENAKLTVLQYEQSLLALGLGSGELELLNAPCEDCRPLPRPTSAETSVLAARSQSDWARADLAEPTQALWLPKASCAPFQQAPTAQIQLRIQRPGGDPFVMSGAVIGEERALVSTEGGGLFELFKDRAESRGAASLHDAAANFLEATYVAGLDGSFGRYIRPQAPFEPLASIPLGQPSVNKIDLITDPQGDLFSLTSSGAMTSAPKGSVWHYQRGAWTQLLALDCADEALACEGTISLKRRGDLISVNSQGQLAVIFPPARYVYLGDVQGLRRDTCAAPWLIGAEFPNSVRWVEDVGLLVGTSEGNLFLRTEDCWEDMMAPNLDPLEGRPIVAIEPFFGGFVYSDSHSPGNLVYYSEATGFCRAPGGTIISRPQQLLTSGTSLWALERAPVGAFTIVTYLALEAPR